MSALTAEICSKIYGLHYDQFDELEAIWASVGSNGAECKTDSPNQYTGNTNQYTDNPSQYTDNTNQYTDNANEYTGYNTVYNADAALLNRDYGHVSEAYYSNDNSYTDPYMEDGETTYGDSSYKSETEHETDSDQDEDIKNSDNANKDMDFMKSYFWNERFQNLLERPTLTPEEAKQRHADIDTLTQRFIEVAKPIVKTIVTELGVPLEKKTIKPVNVGGIAGGEKYVMKQLFFKFAKDDVNIRLYGSDDWAQKAALHELKSLNALIACEVPNLHFPLMAVLMCYGHYVVVNSKLPLTSQTLVYGSANAGNTIKQNREMEKLMKLATQKLNLRPHEVREYSTQTVKTIYGPVDIEGHRGLDGRYYVLDTARLFPPATPIKGIRAAYLYKLLRSELVRTNPVALSSDAFSPFGRINNETYNKDVLEATNRIFKQLIPEVMKDASQFKEGNITDILHSKGINMRYLGVILRKAVETNAEQEIIQAITIEIVARSFKAEVFQKMREIVSSCASEDIDIECKRAAARSLNALLSHGDESNEWWDGILRKIAKERFIFYSTEEWLPTITQEMVFSAADEMLQNGLRSYLFAGDETTHDTLRVKLARRACEASGLILKESVWKRMKSNPSKFFHKKEIFSEKSIEEIAMLAKRITVLPFVDTMRVEGNFQKVEEFYLTELKNRIDSLGPQHPQVAITCVHLAELYSEQRGRMAKAEEMFEQAEGILRVSLGENHIDMADVLERKADLYIRYDKNTLAESVLKRTLEIKANAQPPATPLDIATVLDKLARVSARLNKVEEAFKFYNEALELKKKECGAYSYQVARTLNGKSQLLFQQKKFVEAKRLAVRVLTILKIERGMQNSEVGIAFDNLAKIYAALERRDKAHKLFKKALQIKRATLGANHSHVAMTLDHLASNLYAMHKSDEKLDENILNEIERSYKDALEIFKLSLGEDHSTCAVTLNNLGLFYTGQKRSHEAMECFERAVAILGKTVGPSHHLFKSTQRNLETLRNTSNRGSAKLEPVFHQQHLTANSELRENRNIPEEWHKLFQKATQDVQKAEALIAALNRLKKQASSQDTDSKESKITKPAKKPRRKDRPGRKKRPRVKRPGETNLDRQTNDTSDTAQRNELQPTPIVVDEKAANDLVREEMQKLQEESMAALPPRRRTSTCFSCFGRKKSKARIATSDLDDTDWSRKADATPCPPPPPSAMASPAPIATTATASGRKLKGERKSSESEEALGIEEDLDSEELEYADLGVPLVLMEMHTEREMVKESAKTKHKERAQRKLASSSVKRSSVTAPTDQMSQLEPELASLFKESGIDITSLTPDLIDTMLASLQTSLKTSSNTIKIIDEADTKLTDETAAKISDEADAMLHDEAEAKLSSDEEPRDQPQFDWSYF